MEKQLKEFLVILDNENKDEAILFILDLLDKGNDIVDVYEQLLIPSLREFNCDGQNESICIWKEHTRTSIIRTILEATYPYLIKTKKQKPINKFIVVACPQEEYHEIGAIIASHYFYLMGFKVKYIGANTPTYEIKSALDVMKPDYLALSITDDYNLIQVKKLLGSISDTHPEVKVILGGRAAKLHANHLNLNYEAILNSFQEIKAFRGDFK